MCQPEMPLPLGYYSLILFAAITFFMVRAAGGAKSSLDNPHREWQRLLACVFAFLVMLNLEFGPSIAAGLTGKQAQVESGMIKVERGHKESSEICVSNRCYWTPRITLMSFRKGSDGSTYYVGLLRRVPANGRLLVWPDTGLGGVRVKSLQICDPDWLNRALVRRKAQTP
ncbi:MAG: hypothetical protein RLZZ157_1291 [Pseudomonadota bacterium]|jgi:hypothetical protein